MTFLFGGALWDRFIEKCCGLKRLRNTSSDFGVTPVFGLIYLECVLKLDHNNNITFVDDLLLYLATLQIRGALTVDRRCSLEPALPTGLHFCCFALIRTMS